MKNLTEFITINTIGVVRSMKYRDLITVFLILGFFLSLAYKLGVAKSVWFWILPIGFFIALLWALYYLWLT
jgi:hypothetical protein